MKTALSLLTLIATLTFVGCNDSVYDEQADVIRDNSQEYADDVRERADARAEQVEEYEVAKPSLEEQTDEKADAIEEAVRLNGAAIEMNQRAFRFGRLAAHDRVALDRIARPALRAG